MTRRHRLTVHANLLAQSPRDPRFRIREVDPLGPNSTPPTDHTTLLIHKRHRMCGPGQIVPGPLLRRSHARRAPTTPTAGIAPAAPLHMDLQSTVRLLFPLDPHDPESGQAKNPRTIPPRSHASSLVGSTTRETTPGGPVPSGIALSTSRPPSRPPTPSAVRAGGRVLPQIAVVNWSFCHADSTEPDAQARCQTDGWRCGWVAQLAQSLR